MRQLANGLFKFGLSTLHYSGAANLLAPLTRGQGAIFMLHHVSPAVPRAFEPNRLLTITPWFLDEVCGRVIEAGFEPVSLDEAHRRIKTGRRGDRPFACFTFDDGYRDNRDHALPVLRRHGVPFTVYVATEFADGKGFLWWLVLEEAIRARSSVHARIDGRDMTLHCDSDAQKRAAYMQLYWTLRRMPEAQARGLVEQLAIQAGLDIHEPCRRLAMDWDELRAFADDPLVTIGAHSKNHFALGGLGEAQARDEIAGSVARIERELGRRCQHFAYPYGNPTSAGQREFAIAAACGLKTAVTTAKGCITAAHGRSLTALPRVSLNGEYQKLRYLEPLLSGVPFRLWNAVDRMWPTAPVGADR